MKSKQMTYRYKKATKLFLLTTKGKIFLPKHFLGEMSIISESHYIRKAFKIDCIAISNNDHIDTASKKSYYLYYLLKREKK